MPFFNSVRASYGPVGRGRRFFNSASGGDDVGTFVVTSALLASDPLLEGVGATWKYHHFLNSGTLTVDRALEPFRYVLVGGGYKGGEWTNHQGGLGGKVVSSDSTIFTDNVSFTAGQGQYGSEGQRLGDVTSTISWDGNTVNTTAGNSGPYDVYMTGQEGPWGVSGRGGNGGYCGGSFGVNAGCGSLGDQDYGGAKGPCGCLPDPCYQCGGGCSGCASGHGVWNGHGGGGAGTGQCCSGAAGGAGGRGGFIVAYRIA